VLFVVRTINATRRQGIMGEQGEYIGIGMDLVVRRAIVPLLGIKDDSSRIAYKHRFVARMGTC
jgi:hypothetical protein